MEDLDVGEGWGGLSGNWESVVAGLLVSKLAITTVSEISGSRQEQVISRPKCKVTPVEQFNKRVWWCNGWWKTYTKQICARKFGGMPKHIDEDSQKHCLLGAAVCETAPYNNVYLFQNKENLAKLTRKPYDGAWNFPKICWKLSASRHVPTSYVNYTNYSQ